MATPTRDKYGTFYCRVGVPEKLRAIVGKRELKQTLDTKDPTEARLRFGKVHAEFSRIIENARRQAAGERLLSTRDIEILADRFLENSIEQTEKTGDYRRWFHWTTEADPHSGVEHTYPDSPLWNSINEAARAKDERALTNLVENALRDELAALTGSHGIALDKESTEYYQLSRRVLAKIRPLIEHTARRESGRFSAPDQSRAREKLSTESIQGGLTLMEAWEAYQKRLERDIGQRAAEKRVNDYKASIIGLAEYQGDLPLSQFTADHLREYRDFLYELPQRPPKAIASLPIRQRPAAAASRGLGTLSRATVRNRMIHCSALFRAALDMPGSGLDRSPLEGVELPPKRTMQDQGKRPDFKPEELTAVFQGEWFAPEPHKPRDRIGAAAVWLPVVLYYTGARLEEIAAMNAEDLRQIQGSWAFDIRPEGEDRSLKNEQSARVVPVHPDLIDLGLLDYAKSLPQGGKLWPELRVNSEGKHGYLLSKRFRHYLDGIGVRKEVKPAHGFRHAFATMLREQGTDEAVITGLFGHAHQGQTNRYGSHLLKLRAEAVDRLPSVPGLRNIRATLATFG